MTRASRAALVGMALVLVAAPLAAQTRPLETETALTVDAGTTTLETGGAWMADEPNFLTGNPRDRWAVPLVRLVHAPADGIELDLEWAGLVGAIDDPDFGSSTDWGDLTLRAKWRFRKRDAGLNLGVRFEVTLPQTEAVEGLGPNTLRFSAQVLTTRVAGAWTFHLNGGLAIHDQLEDAGLQSDFLDYGLALERRLWRSWQLVGEVSGLAGAGSIGTESHAEARLGIRHGLGRLAWDAAVRRGLLRADGNWGATLGLSWTLQQR